MKSDIRVLRQALQTRTSVLLYLSHHEVLGQVTISRSDSRSVQCRDVTAQGNNAEPDETTQRCVVPHRDCLRGRGASTKTDHSTREPKAGRSNPSNRIRAIGLITRILLDCGPSGHVACAARRRRELRITSLKAIGGAIPVPGRASLEWWASDSSGRSWLIH